MSKMSLDNGQSMFKYERLDEGIPEDDCSRFIVRFMDMFFPVLNIEKKREKKGCPAYPPREMFKLVLYAFYRGLTNIELLSENAR